MPANVLPRIFDLYFTTKSKGSGIGLAMTYRILQLHGGTLSVRSDADPLSTERGTVFTLRLPLSMGAGADTRRSSWNGEKHVGDSDGHAVSTPGLAAASATGKENL